MSKILKDALALTAITLVAGLALGGVYEITKDPIAYQKALKKQKACKEVFVDADAFEAVELDANLADQIRKALDEDGYAAQEVTEVMEAVDASDNSLGYVITVVSGEGYGGDIQFSVGIKADGTVNGISILTIGETAGLGMNANTDAFKSQFANKNVDAFVVTKQGAKNDNEIDAISGATITTKAMTNGVNAGICAFEVLKGGN